MEHETVMMLAVFYFRWAIMNLVIFIGLYWVKRLIFD